VKSAILLVESEPARLDSLSRALNGGGFEVTATNTFDAAIAALRQRSFDGVVTAHHLGTHNGVHVVLRVNNDRPGAMAVVTTATPDPILEREAAAFGAVTIVAPWRDTSPLLVLLKSLGVAPV